MSSRRKVRSLLVLLGTVALLLPRPVLAGTDYTAPFAGASSQSSCDTGSGTTTCSLTKFADTSGHISASASLVPSIAPIGMGAAESAGTVFVEFTIPAGTKTVVVDVHATGTMHVEASGIPPAVLLAPQSARASVEVDSNYGGDFCCGNGYEYIDTFGGEADRTGDLDIALTLESYEGGTLIAGPVAFGITGGVSLTDTAGGSLAASLALTVDRVSINAIPVSGVHA